MESDSRISRREFALRTTAAAAFLASPGPRDALDEALGILADTGPEWRGGLANHGPMAAEALCAMGRAESAAPWAKSYRSRLQPLPKGTTLIDPQRWRDSLGDGARMGDWIEFFSREVEERPWKETLDLWTARLSPGIAAAAFHGALRTGHAARGLAAKENALRRRELANGLGYWAARYKTLPVSDSAPPTKLTCAEAIRRVETLQPKRSAPSGFITDALRALDEMPSFASVLGLVDVTGDPSKFLTDLTSTFAQVYLANGARSTIVFVHGVTGPSVVRLLLPHVREETARSALRYAWQAAAALYAAFGLKPAPEPAASGPSEIRVEELVARAVANGDEHAIKFTEACLREHSADPKPAYLLAARDALDRL